jgi:hypothetical protein
MSRPRKPTWLRILCPAGNLSKLVPVRCAGCGQWIISCRQEPWQSYDPGILHGPEDLSIAIILNRPLTRINWITGLNQPSLRDPYGTYGIDQNADYLAAHECRHTPISNKPYKPPAKPHAKKQPWGTGITASEIREFEKAWNHQ